MEKKIELNLCANYQLSELKDSIINSVLCDYVIEELRLAIKRFNKEDLDLFYIYEDFKVAIEKGNQITYSSINDWKQNKIDTYQDCLRIVVALDDLAAKEGKIAAGELIEEFGATIQDYAILLSVIEVTLNSIDFKGVEVRDEFVENLISQLSLVDEGQFLSDLGLMKIDMYPLDVNKFRNKFVEQKLSKINKIADDVERSLWNEFERLHNEITKAYDKLYKIAHAALSDGEKVDAEAKVVKLVKPHRLILDALENRLTAANEIKRQLSIHSDKLQDSMDDANGKFDADLQERPYEQETIERDRDGMLFVTAEYIDKIVEARVRINQIEEEIAERYKILDRVENALDGAIATESEMKRYSNLAFKFEDLYVRLALAKSQIKDKDPDFVVALNTAITGLGVLVNISLSGKEIFMRNNLLSAVFGCVNGIYDIVDNKNKSVELSQVKFVTTRLVKYSVLNNTLTKDLQTFRHVCNNTIRDVAMMMGKPFNLRTMVDIVENIQLSIEQLQELVKTLDENHVEQTRVLGDIFNIR